MEPETLDIFFILAWVTFGGALGGIAEYLRQIKYRDQALRTNSDVISPSPFILLLLFSTVIGVAGAIAFQFILILLKSYRDANTPENILFFFAVSVAAGFGARHLLPQITEKLGEQVKNLTAETHEAREQVKNLQTETKELAQGTENLAKQAEKAASRAEGAARRGEEAMITTRVLHALTPTVLPGDKKRCIEELTKFLEDEPKHRRFVIYRGRLYRALGDYTTAISTLDKYLNLKTQEGEYDEHYADVLYNKACYYSLLCGETEEESKKEEYKKLAFESLSTSIDISPENKNDARIDPDFEPLRVRNPEEFETLIQ